MSVSSELLVAVRCGIGSVPKTSSPITAPLGVATTCADPAAERVGFTLPRVGCFASPHGRGSARTVAHSAAIIAQTRIIIGPSSPTTGVSCARIAGGALRRR